MNHRDKIAIQKIISEIDTGLEIFNNMSFEDFENNETIKRAVCITTIKSQLNEILTKEIID